MIEVCHAGKTLIGVVLEQRVGIVAAVYECQGDDCEWICVITCTHEVYDDDACAEDHGRELARLMKAHVCGPSLAPPMPGEVAA